MMNKKVLIAEDHQSTNISIQKVLEDLGNMDSTYVYYCDDALVRVRHAASITEPFDLLITDLSFDPDHREPKLADGVELIAAARVVQPGLPVLVFSAEGRIPVIEQLYTVSGIDGFVRKGRNDARELELAIRRIVANERYYPPFYLAGMRKGHLHDFSPFDIAIITLMAEGKRQKDLPARLEERGIRPAGLSSVEKRLKLMREALAFSNNEQLVAYCKDMGLV